MSREKAKSKKTALFWLWKAAGRRKSYILLLGLLQVVLGMSGVCYALFLRGMIDGAAAGDGVGFLCGAQALVALTVLRIALRAAGRVLEESTRSAMENQCSARLFSVLLRKDYAAVTAVHSGEWVNRLTSDAAVVADGLVQIVPGAAGMTARMAGAVGTLLVLEPRFGYILLPGGALLLILTGSFRRVLKSLHKRVQEAEGRLRAFFQERLSSLMILRAFGQERQTSEQAWEHMRSRRAARMRRIRFSSLSNIGFGAAMNGAYVFGAVFCGYGILTGTMSYGTFTAVLQLIGQVQSPLANITGYVPRYYAMLSSAERLMEAEAYKEDCPRDAVCKEEIRRFYENDFAGIGMENAGFTYLPPVLREGEAAAMPVVLSGLDLEIRKGEYAAFIGPSGCGKSTVLKLLMALYPLDAGERYLLTAAGTREPLTARWRGMFAYVPQGNQLLSGTIREIVAFGDRGQMEQEDRLYQALRSACADGFVSELKQGLDTVLGERGTGLSEGQLQRVAIARAVFSGRPVLLLDEATSALDEATEARLLANLRAMTDRTVLIVTHRPAALAITDRVIDLGAWTAKERERGGMRDE